MQFRRRGALLPDGLPSMLYPLIAWLFLCLLTAPGARAQDWPTKPIRLLVPFPPGGSSDVVARVLRNPLQTLLGGQILIDNRPGEGGTTGSAEVARAMPDGHTFLVSSLGPFVIAPHLVRNLSYDPLKDFDYITVTVQAPNVLAVSEHSPLKSLHDLHSFMKANPGTMTFASAGVGTSDHLTAELFWRATGTSGMHVPYKGGAPAMVDLLGGHVDATFMNINSGLPHFRTGRLRPLAVTGARRSAALPSLPTLEESGLKDVIVTSWQAFAAPKGVSPEIKAKLHAALVTSLSDPAVRTQLLDLGFEIVGNAPEQFTAFQANEFARWKKVIEEHDIDVE